MTDLEALMELVAERDAARAEVERLRAALKAIAEFGQDNIEYADKCAIMAWEALDGAQTTTASSGSVTEGER